jgi:hypothetical protein
MSSDSSGQAGSEKWITIKRKDERIQHHAEADHQGLPLSIKKR